MTDYLKNLAATLVNPGSGVQPRLPGLFEPQHPIGVGPLDLVPGEEVVSASQESAREQSSAPYYPLEISDDSATFSIDAPAPGDRPGKQPESAPIIAPPEIRTEPSGTSSQPRRTESPRPRAEPGGEGRFGEANLEMSSLETKKRPAPFAEAGPVSSVFQPDLLVVPPDGDTPGSGGERPPEAFRADEPQPDRPRPPSAAPVIKVEVRPESVPETAKPIALKASEAAQFDQGGSASPSAETGRLPPRIEPAPPPAGIEPPLPLGTQETPREPVPERVGREPVLGRVDEKPAVETLFTEQKVPRAKVDQGPTIRVTIGRIEVRASLPPAPTPRPQPERQRPTLPLDEYLKRRSEGKG